MQGQVTEEKITVKAAAHLLEVATKTIQRYLAKGRLTRIKQGTRTLLLLSEVKALSGHPTMGQGRSLTVPKKAVGSGQPGDTVTLSRDRYEQLLLELGELRKQNQFFLEFKGMLLAKEEGIRRLERDVEELRTRVHALEFKKHEEYWADAHQEPPAAAGREETKPKQKKPWWQA
jgi:hypothetical protein